MSWLNEHFETFVDPTLESMEVDEGHNFRFVRPPMVYFTPEELTVIKNVWRSVKSNAKDKPVLLAGRDVFIWEVLAQREGYPTLFMPEISRQTVKHVKIENLHEYHLFDTGFAGTIPHNLGCEDFSLLSFAGNHNPKSKIMRDPFEVPNTKTQVFPRLTFSRGLALKIELTPKYWESARMVLEDDGDYGKQVILQPMSRRDEFIAAARLTREIYTNSVRKFIPKHKPIESERW